MKRGTWVAGKWDPNRFRANVQSLTQMHVVKTRSKTRTRNSNSPKAIHETPVHPVHQQQTLTQVWRGSESWPKPKRKGLIQLM